MNNLVQNEAINKKNLETGVPFLTRVCLPARGSTAKIGLPRDWHFFLTDWQAADNQELIISLKQKFKTQQNLHGWMVILFSLSAPISPTFYHL